MIQVNPHRHELHQRCPSAAADPPSVDALYRYPVKGLTPEPLQRVTARAPARRALRPRLRHRERSRPLRSRAPAAPAQDQLPDADARRAPGDAARPASTTRRETLTILRDGKQVARGQLDDPLGRQLIEQFLAAYMKAELRGAPRIVSRPGHSFSDVRGQVRAHRQSGDACASSSACWAAPVDPLRFRAQRPSSTGSAPWAEFGWVGKALRARRRCACRCSPARSAARRPTSIPATGARDMAIPAAAAAHLGPYRLRHLRQGHGRRHGRGRRHRSCRDLAGHGASRRREARTRAHRQRLQSLRSSILGARLSAAPRWSRLGAAPRGADGEPDGAGTPAARAAAAGSGRGGAARHPAAADRRSLRRARALG